WTVRPRAFSLTSARNFFATPYSTSASRRLRRISPSASSMFSSVRVVLPRNLSLALLKPSLRTSNMPNHSDAAEKTEQRDPIPLSSRGARGEIGDWSLVFGRDLIKSNDFEMLLEG